MKSRQELQTLFKEIDTDNSGELDIYEIVEQAEKIGVQTQPEDIAKLFKEIDTNGDGMVSFDEFTAWYRLGADSVLKNYQKDQLKYQAKFNFLKGKYSGSQIIGGNESNKMDVIHQQIGHDFYKASYKTSLKFLFEGKLSNQKLLDSLKNSLQVLFLEEPVNPLLFFQIKAKDQEASEILKESISDMLTNLKDFLVEVLPDFEDYIQQQKYEVGCCENSVYIGFDMVTQMLLAPFIEILYSFLDFVNTLQPKVKFEFKTRMDLHRLRDLKSRLVTTNLVTEIFNDFQFLWRVTAANGFFAGVKELAENFTNEEMQFAGDGMSGTIGLVASRLFRNLYFKLGLQPGKNGYELIQKCQFGGNAQEFEGISPNYRDLVQSLAFFLDSSKFQGFKKSRFTKVTSKVIFLKVL